MNNCKQTNKQTNKKKKERKKETERKLIDSILYMSGYFYYYILSMGTRLIVI
jgi:hypothetical protein